MLDATFYADGGAKSGQHGDKDLNHQSYDFLLSHRLNSLKYPTANPSFINHPWPLLSKEGELVVLGLRVFAPRPIGRGKGEGLPL